jgi:hypothetical protein
MKDNLFTEVFLSMAVTKPIQVNGWVNQTNPYERYGQRWRLYVSRVEMLRRLSARYRKTPSSPT